MAKTRSQHPHIGEAAQPHIDEGLRRTFNKLALKWSSATAHLSSPSRMAEHPAYREIIDLGAPALPLILRDLTETGRFWFPALNVITGENPVPSSAAGDIDKMTDAWIEWGRGHGLI
jgi:hypothetical protein